MVAAVDVQRSVPGLGINAIAGVIAAASAVVAFSFPLPLTHVIVDSGVIATALATIVGMIYGIGTIARATVLAAVLASSLLVLLMLLLMLVLLSTGLLMLMVLLA